MDRQKKKSDIKEKICENFALLISQGNEIEDIKAIDLIKESGISKSTFYRYFKDVFEVFEYMLDAFARKSVDTFFAVVSDVDMTIFEGITEDIDYTVIMNMFDFDLTDKAVVDYLCVKKNYRAYHIITQKCINAIKENLDGWVYDTETLEYFCEFIINGVLFSSLFSYWNNGKIARDAVDFLISFTDGRMDSDNKVLVL